MYDKITDPNAKCSALKVNPAIEQPNQVNKDFLQKPSKSKTLTINDFVSGILNKDRIILSQAITLVESSRYDHQEKAQKIIEQCLPFAGKSIRLGITGVPGVGKSTVIDVLGTSLTKTGHKVAVLAIDPSSERSKGSILGDKTRMEDLSTDPNAFIRPSPSAGSLGGVARKTREIIILCEAAGFDVVIVETVGVGQSEVVAHSMVDFFLLLQLANAGDELQGIKRGIMEMADAIAINKAEGENKQKAEIAAGQYRNALHLFPISESGWKPSVFTCSAYSQDNINLIWQTVNDYVIHTKANNYFYKKRNEQNLKILSESIDSHLKENFYTNPIIIKRITEAKKEILENQISAYVAAQKLIEVYFNNINKEEI
ncbi:MAG: methylmalonyl Co-A mutase-associated GTPase MeaB [Bacteroidales bacterium]|jgi:LAO/AO transport system kinase|nr:methylmalonyl Co-A mutase-associated GTPase MeaB [Bacteroidales bacterium]MDD4830273.1 methylmalonyl Co-A mutase-associated GTPase MeaB [Bacteroidales bacterium]